MTGLPETSASEEDLARANLYALLSRLLYRGADAALLASIAASGDAIGSEESAPLAQAWRDLARACAQADVAAVQQEFEEVFTGTGKARVTPYCSYYLAETGREKVLVRLREELEGLGLARVASVGEPEDHIAGLLEVMRHLVLANGGDIALHKQRAIFERYIERAYARFCDDLSACPEAGFYRFVARVLRSFLEVESQALKME
ncbi:MAG: molecular chaperone TorD family protein [Betaproteobacteria bacterium]|nr:molecular chaperone TorD family protein [Betaproteobacteria bacterium]